MTKLKSLKIITSILFFCLIGGYVLNSINVVYAIERAPTPEKQTIERAPDPEKQTIERMPAPEVQTIERQPMPEKQCSIWTPPTPEEQALEDPWIDPIDILTMFGTGFFRSLFKGGKALANETVYYYFKDSSGKIANAITKNGIKVSRGFFHTLGYEGRVFVSNIPPNKISKLNLFSYGNSGANSYVKIAINKGDLSIPAQAVYYGEKGARTIKNCSGLYSVGDDGVKYLNKKAIKEIGSLAPYKKNVNGFLNNLINMPRALTRYWVIGGLGALNGYGYSRK